MKKEDIIHEITFPSKYSNEEKLSNIGNIGTYGRFKNIDTILEYKQFQDLYKKSSFALGQSFGGLNKSSELNIDFSEYANHCFFDIARVKHDAAFEVISDFFPFDGTFDEMVEFIESLNGYQKYIFDNLPRRQGYVNFTGSNYIETKRFEGTYSDIISSNVSGLDTLDRFNSFSVDFLFRPVTGANETYSLTSKMDTDQDSGFNIYFVTQTSDRIKFTFETLTSSISIDCTASVDAKNWHHLAFVHDQDDDLAFNAIFVDGKLKSKTLESSREEFGEIYTDDNLYIASSSNGLFSDAIPFVGSIDEYRIWSKALKDNEVKGFMKRNAYSQDDLLLCYKFNEHLSKSVVLDTSGHNLHSEISNSGIYSADFRDSGTFGFSNPMLNEDTYYFPSLFSDDQEYIDFYSETYLSASEYDYQNESKITDLIPPHYLQEVFEGNFELNEHAFDDVFSGSNSDFTEFIIKWFHLIGSFFDEIKVFIDNFSNILTYDCTDEDNSGPDKLATKISSLYGLDLKSIFNEASFNSMFMKEGQFAISDNAVAEVRKKLWRRVFSMMPVLLKSKGTLFSVKSLLRTFGINADSNFRFIEFGGINRGEITSENRVNRSKNFPYLYFSATNSVLTSSLLSSSFGETFFGSTAGVNWLSRDFTIGSNVRLGDNGFDSLQSIMRLKSRGSFISGGTEPFDFVHAQVFAAKDIDAFVTGVNDFNVLKNAGNTNKESVFNPNNFILTPLDGAQENLFNFPNMPQFGGNNNIFTPKGYVGLPPKIHRPTKPDDTSDSSTNPFSPIQKSSKFDKYLSELGFSSFDSELDVETIHRSDFPIVGVLLGLPGNDPKVSSIMLTGTNVFNGNNWFVSLGKKFVNDTPFSGTVFTLYAGETEQRSDNKFSAESIKLNSDKLSGSTFVYDFNTKEPIAPEPFRFRAPDDFNDSIYVEFGKPSHELVGSAADFGYAYLNTGSFVISGNLNQFDNLHSTSFDGFLGHTVFYTQYLDEAELREHSRNYRSVGVAKPATNFNFVSEYKKLRIDATFEHSGSCSDSNGVVFVDDFSQNDYTMTGSGFEPNKEVFEFNILNYSFIGPNYDESPNNDQVRIWAKEDKPSEFGYLSPLYNIPDNTRVDTDSGFSIEFSPSQIVNEDIVNIFGSLNSINNAFDMTSQYSFGYKDLNTISDIYFERFTEPMNIKIFFDLFLWINNNVFNLIEQLIPNKTNYLGANYVIESHILDRNKFWYMNSNMFDRSGKKDLNQKFSYSPKNSDSSLIGEL